MRNRLCTFLGCFLIFCASAIPVHAEADTREAVTLPTEVRDAFLAEMRGHLGNLDDILTAVAEGNFKEAADISDIKMDFGHMMWQGMAEQGMSADQILVMKQRMRKMGAGMGPAQGGGQGGGMGRGMGRFMPEHFRAMGQGFHQAAADFSTVARGVGANPTVAEYRKVIGALEAVTTICRSCHDTFRVQ